MPTFAKTPSIQLSARLAGDLTEVLRELLQRELEESVVVTV